MQKKKSKNPPTFEEAFAIAERATESLERGDLTLEDCLEEYERGARALRDCYAVLKQTQKRLEVLSSEIAGAADVGDGETPSSENVPGTGSAWVLAQARGPLKEVIEKLDASEALDASEEPDDESEE